MFEINVDTILDAFAVASASPRPPHATIEFFIVVRALSGSEPSFNAELEWSRDGMCFACSQGLAADQGGASRLFAREWLV